MTAPGEEPLLELRAVMGRLRAECSWKAAQTHRSLVRHLLEEAHEVADAVDELLESGDAAPLREELGDLLLQVFFHAAIAEQDGRFTVDDVASGIVAKLRRRNPHVFGGEDGAPVPDPGDPAAVNALWERVKAAEKPRRGVTDGLPSALPALLYADKVLDRLARLDGADAGPGGPDDAPAPAPAPGSAEAEASARRVGDRLLGVLEDARGEGTDPEQALRDAVRRRLAARDPGAGA